MNERGFNPKSRPLDSGSGAGMTAMERPPSVGTAEGKREKMGPRTREDKGRGKMGPRIREDKEGEGGSRTHYGGESDRRGVGRWVPAAVDKEGGMGWCMEEMGPRTREDKEGEGKGGSPHSIEDKGNTLIHNRKMGDVMPLARTRLEDVRRGRRWVPALAEDKGIGGR